jgi:hypothetical protein
MMACAPWWGSKEWLVAWYESNPHTRLIAVENVVERMYRSFRFRDLFYSIFISINPFEESQIASQL